MNVLTIAIPTWNNSKHLERTLKKVLQSITASKNYGKISVYVSNNGSYDSSSDIIESYSSEFKKYFIDFTFYHSIRNKGFDTNVLRCFYSAKSEYVWFLSDDDEICSNSIAKIFFDIHKYNPGIIYYDFLQPPDTTKNTPYIKREVFYDASNSVVNSLYLIVSRPKLTSIVLNRTTFKLADLKEMLNYKRSMFMHLALVFNIFRHKKSCLVSNYFIASAREDYFEQINFTASVANQLYDLVLNISSNYKCSFTPEDFNLKKVDELSISLTELGAFLRGSTVYSNIRIGILKAKIILGLRRYSFLQNKWVFLIAVLKLVFSAIVYLVKFSVGREAKIKKFDNRMTSEAIKDTEFIIRKTSPIINKHR